VTDIEQTCFNASQAELKLCSTDTAYRNGMLFGISNAIKNNHKIIIDANLVDLEVAKAKGRDDAFLDRLKLDDNRIDDMAEGVNQIISLPDPVGEVTENWITETGLDIKKVRAPIGTIAIIYEARPNVTVDATALCIKSGNAVILRGSQEAYNTNFAIFQIMQNALKNGGYVVDAIQMVKSKEREVTTELLQQNQYIDLVIPRGGEGLKKFVLANATMPVIASAGGNCHTYVEATADFQLACNVILNAKLSRPSTCNALEQLLVDREIASKFLPIILTALREKGVIIKADQETKKIFPDALLATEQDYKTEFNDYIIAVKIVDGIEEAIKRINENGTKHSESIITQRSEYADKFTKEVDSACVYVNTSTRFTDGFQFGFGAEMGISTQKLHARGPLGLKQLTSERYIIFGNGQIRK